MNKSHAADWAPDSPTPAQLKEFFAQIGSGRITKDRLQRFLRERDWFLFTTSALTLNELMAESRHPHESDPRWKDEPFANKTGKVQKLLLRTSAVPNSFYRTWEEQQELLAEGECVLTTRSLVEGILTYYQKTGEKLFSDCLVRTQDVYSNGSRAIVEFSGERVSIIEDFENSRGPGLGLAVARKHI